MQGKKLYVGNLPFTTTDQELREIFAQLGRVASAQVATCRDTGRSKGFGFVEMISEDEAQSAISQFHGVELGGRPIVVNEFRA
jgi:RNA recognition motif-containing protein